MWWKNVLTKNLWWPKKDNEDFENSTNVGSAIVLMLMMLK